MMVKLTLICTLLCILPSDFVICDDLVVTTDASTISTEKNSLNNIKAQIYEMSVETNVTNRFAKTLITSKVKNPDTKSKQVTFSVVLPEKAFISEFIMEIDDKQYKAYIKEKEEAKKTYDQAVSQGQSAAHVSVSARDSNRFTVDVNVEAEGKAIFLLTYEELLERKKEMYEVVLNIQPGEPVKDLKIQVNINETRPLKFARSAALRSGNEISKTSNENLDPNADVQILDKNTAVIKFHPDVKKQQEFAKELGTKEENGLAGQFVVQYEVERDPQGGEILLNEGFFVHFFAPSEIQSLPKYVVFVLDTSGSMSGQRLTQLQEAMDNILTDLKEEDTFSIVEFDYVAKVWNVGNVTVDYQTVERFASPEEKEKHMTEKLPPPYVTSSENIKKAKEVVNKFQAHGGTNIKEALGVGLDLVEYNQQSNQPLIIFLTDGEATVGETNPETIIKSITDLNTKKTPIFTLSFGNGADKKFLEKISLQNSGFARHIYEGADASLQLSEFYQIVSSPLLTNVKFKYVSNVTELTKTYFPIFFRGGELVVAGKALGTFESSIEAKGKGGPIILRPKVETPVTSLERLWAYLTVKQLLDERKIANNKTEIEAEALRMALKYSFVTDVTSLVVVKPNATSAVNTEDASKILPSPYRLNAAFGPSGYKSIHQYSASSTYYGPTTGEATNFFVRKGRPGPSHRTSISHYPPRYPMQPCMPGATPYVQVVSGGRPLPPCPTTPRSFPRPGGYPSPPGHWPPPGYPSPADNNDNNQNLGQYTTLRTTTRTTVPQFYTPPIPRQVIDQLKSSMPWMAYILAPNGTLTTPNGTLHLNINKNSSRLIKCDLPSPNNSTTTTKGSCSPLITCKETHPKITSLEIFLTYTCDTNGLTGICCPYVPLGPGSH